MAAFAILEALLLFLLSVRPGLEHHINRIVLTAFPFSLLLLRNNFHDVLPLQTLLTVIGLLCIVSFIYSAIREIRPELLWKLLEFSMPGFLFLATVPWNILVQYLNEWRLLAEEGQLMGWVTRVSHGDIPYRDALVTRGPAVIYSLVWILKLFGQSLLMKRAWLLSLNVMISYAYYHLLRTLIPSRFLRFALFLPIIQIHNPSYRVGFGFLAVAFYLQSLRSPALWRGVLSGASIAVALLSSIEIGICSLITIPATGLVGILLHPGDRKSYLKSTMLALAGLLAVLLPLVLYFWISGDLGEIIRSILVYPKYAMLGYASIPYPNLAGFVRQDLAMGRWWLPVVRKIFLMWYLPIVIYCFSFFLLVRWIVSRKVDAGVVALFCVTLFGWISYRSALGRSDTHHLYFCVSQAFILTTLYAERIRGGRTWREVARDRERLLVIGLLVLFPLFFLMQRPQDNLIPPAKIFAENLTGKISGDKEYASFELDRLRGIQAPLPVKDRIETVVRVLRRFVKPGEKIYAFPNLPLYYFLLDAPNPTPYEWAYQAITSDMRLQVVKALEMAQPKFIIVSRNPAQQLDRIPPEEAVPEILDYIESHYTTWRSFGQEEIQVRTEEGSLPRKRPGRLDRGVQPAQDELQTTGD